MNNNNVKITADDYNERAVVGYLVSITDEVYPECDASWINKVLIRIVLNFTKPVVTAEEIEKKEAETYVFSLPRYTRGLKEVCENAKLGSKIAITGNLSTTEDAMPFFSICNYLEIKIMNDDAEIIPPDLTTHRNNAALLEHINEYRKTDRWLGEHGDAEQTITGYLKNVTYNNHNNTLSLSLWFSEEKYDNKNAYHTGSYKYRHSFVIGAEVAGAEKMWNTVKEIYKHDYYSDGYDADQKWIKVSLRGYTTNKKGEFNIIPYCITVKPDTEEIVEPVLPRDVPRTSELPYDWKHNMHKTPRQVKVRP